MNTDDKSTILEFLGWKKDTLNLNPIFVVWRKDGRCIDDVGDNKLDSNLLAQALAKLSEEQRDLVWDALNGIWLNLHRGGKFKVDSGSRAWMSYWLLFDCPLSTKAEVVAGVLTPT